MYTPRPYNKWECNKGLEQIFIYKTNTSLQRQNSKCNLREEQRMDYIPIPMLTYNYQPPRKKPEQENAPKSWTADDDGKVKWIKEKHKQKKTGWNSRPKKRGYVWNVWSVKSVKPFNFMKTENNRRKLFIF